MNAIEMLEDYKNKGERVDEVLFNHISKELHHLRTVINQKNFSIDLIGEQKFEAQTENKRLREALGTIVHEIDEALEHFVEENTLTEIRTIAQEALGWEVD